MTPRVDIVSIPDDTGFNEILKTITDSGFSRLPLYKKNLDDIMGIIYAKDLLPYLRNDDLRRRLKLSEIARKALFVPSSKLISELLREFQQQRVHIAVVLDEYGGTAGLRLQAAESRGCKTSRVARVVEELRSGGGGAKIVV